MTDQKRDGRAISLLSVIVIVLLVVVSMLSAVAIVEHYHARLQAPPPDAAEKNVKTERIPLELQYETAVHESGHAVLNYAYISARPLDQIWLNTEKREDDRLLGLTVPGEVQACYPEDTWDRSIALFFLGGLASEQVILNKKPPDAYEDKDAAGEETLDYCEKVGCACPPASKVGGQCLLKDMMRAERGRLYDLAVRCLEANKETVVSLANQLFRKPPEEADGGQRRVLGADELKTFFAEHPLAPCSASPVQP